MSGQWALIVRGGAKEIEPEKAEANRAGCRAALSAGRAILEAGGTAVDAVVAAVRVLEADPTFNAGTGGQPNPDGIVERDAGLMDGATLDIGAVAATAGAPRAIALAAELLREPPILLAGAGARRFAASRGLLVDGQESDKVVGPEARHDTVGCVALDRRGSLAAGTSTGGLEGMPAGRVGDSPLPGCGFYADDLLGAACVSGDGESIARLVLAARVADSLERTDVATACRDAIGRLRRVGGEAGIIAIDRSGAIGWDHNSPHFAVACASSRDPEGSVLLRRPEWAGP